MLTLLTYSINVYTAYIKIFKHISQIMISSRIFLIITLSISVEIFSLEVLEVKILNSYSITKEFPGKLLPTEQSKLSFEIPGKIKAINVVGTNGKNSTIQACYSILKEAGIKCNVYTSPHIQKINERFVFNNEQLKDGELASLFEEVEKIIKT